MPPAHERFKALLIDQQGRVTRLVPPGEQPPKLSRRELKKNAGKPLYDWRTASSDTP